MLSAINDVKKKFPSYNTSQICNIYSQVDKGEIIFLNTTNESVILNCKCKCQRWKISHFKCTSVKLKEIT